MSFVWTKELEDQFLNLMLPCRDALEYQRCLVTFGALFGRGPDISIDEGEQWLRRRSNRRTEYWPDSVRNNRQGEAWSWVEEKILDWALVPSRESGKGPAGADYLAGLLQRSTQEVQEKIDSRGTEKMGIKGLW